MDRRPTEISKNMATSTAERCTLDLTRRPTSRCLVSTGLQHFCIAGCWERIMVSCSQDNWTTTSASSSSGLTEGPLPPEVCCSIGCSGRRLSRRQSLVQQSPTKPNIDTLYNKDYSDQLRLRGTYATLSSNNLIVRCKSQFGRCLIVAKYAWAYRNHQKWKVSWTFNIAASANRRQKSNCGFGNCLFKGSDFLATNCRGNWSQLWRFAGCARTQKSSNT